MDWHWIATTGTALVGVFLSSLGIYIALLTLTRISGLRSFSKMSSFDFAITVAFGSVIASTLLAKNPPLLTGIFALAVLYAIQYVISRARRAAPLIERVVDNEPLVLMIGSEVRAEHMDKARMTLGDLKSKLRMAGITHRRQVFAVIMESTGDVSVLRTTDDIDPWLFEQVRGGEALRAALLTA